jgi:hypothetical protein
VRFSDGTANLPWIVYPGMAIASAGADGSGTFGHVRGTGSTSAVPSQSPALGSKGGAVAPAAFNASVDSNAISFAPSTLTQGLPVTLHGVVNANDSVYGIPVEWWVTEPASSTAWKIGPTTWLYGNGPLHVVANFTPRMLGDHDFELRIGEGYSDANPNDNSGAKSGDAEPDANASSPVLSAIAPDKALRGTALAVAISGAKLTAGATLDCGAGIAVTDWTVQLNPGDTVFGNAATATFTLDALAAPGLRSCTLTTAHGASTLAAAFRVQETLCDGVVCADAPGPCHLPAGTCSPQNGACSYALAPEGTPCTDNAACTTGSTCTATGTCGVSNPLSCNDGIPCTAESCDPQVGCLNAPNGPTCNTQCLTGGDINGSGSVNVADGLCLVLTSLWAVTPNNPNPRPACLQGPIELADTNCNGTINVLDVQLTIQMALGMLLDPSIDTDADGCPNACEIVPL